MSWDPEAEEEAALAGWFVSVVEKNLIQVGHEQGVREKGFVLSSSLAP